MTGTNERRYCVLAVDGPMAGQTKAALMDEFKWQAGTRIRVGFVDGDPQLHQRVRAVAEEWTGAKMANLQLQFVPGTETADADIRIAFKQGDGSWSYLGTVCRQIPASEPTMNYGWLTARSSDEEVREVVLHEFGHALGLIHEHQNPERAIAWNRAAVIADLSGPPNRWDEATIEHNIFKRYDPDEVTGTPVDRFSIMMYPIPAAWTTDGFSAGFNTDLSDVDRAFIREAYPW